MPFKSEAQRRFMFAKHPNVAKEFSAATPKGAKLPQHVKKANKAAGIHKGLMGEGNGRGSKY